MLRHIFGRDQKPSKFDAEIDAVLQKMHDEGPLSDQYDTLLNHLKKLNEMKTRQRRNPVSLDTVVMCGANLVGILLIGGIEREHVITSKSFTQLIRPTPPQ